MLEKMKKSLPKWNLKPVEEFYEDPKRRSFDFAGYRFTKEIKPEKMTEIGIKMVRDPHPSLITKIVCEFLTIWNLHRHSLIRKLMHGLIEVHPDRTHKRISISPDAGNRIYRNTSHQFQGYRHLEDISFAGHHYLQLRLSQWGALYVELVFFGQLKNLFVLGKLTEPDDYIPFFVNKTMFFPLDGPIVAYDNYPNVRLKDTSITDDCRAEWIIAQLNERP
jgi:hypothetical protein